MVVENVIEFREEVLLIEGEGGEEEARKGVSVNVDGLQVFPPNEDKQVIKTWRYGGFSNGGRQV